MKILNPIYHLNFCPKCDTFGVGAAAAGVAGAVGTITAAQINADAQDRTNEANIKMTEATNQTNLDIAKDTNATNERNTAATNQANLEIHREDNAFNAEQAQLTREWNSEQATMQRRKEAGINPLTGDYSSGSSAQASSSPAPSMQVPQVVTPTMQAPQSVAPHIDEAAIGNSVSTIATNVATVAEAASEAKKNKEEAKRINAETRYYKIVNEFTEKQKFNEILIQSQQLENLKKQGNLTDEQVATEKQQRQYIYYSTKGLVNDAVNKGVGLYFSLVGSQHFMNQDSISVADLHGNITQKVNELNSLRHQFADQLKYNTIRDSYSFGSKRQTNSNNFQFSNYSLGNSSGFGLSSGSNSSHAGFGSQMLGFFSQAAGSLSFGDSKGQNFGGSEGGSTLLERTFRNDSIAADFARYLGALTYLSENPDSRDSTYWKCLSIVKTSYPKFEQIENLYKSSGNMIFGTSSNPLSEIERY